MELYDSLCLAHASTRIHGRSSQEAETMLDLGHAQKEHSFSHGAKTNGIYLSSTIVTCEIQMNDFLQIQGAVITRA